MLKDQLPTQEAPVWDGQNSQHRDKFQPPKGGEHCPGHRWDVPVETQNCVSVPYSLHWSGRHGVNVPLKSAAELCS